METKTIEEVYRLQPDQPSFFKTIGMKTIRIEDDGCVSCSITVQREMLNSHRTCQGGAIYSLCDAVCGAYLRLNGTPSVTVDGHMSYYKPAMEGDIITVRVSPRRVGRTIKSLMAVVKNQNGDHICDSWFTFVAAER